MASDAPPQGLSLRGAIRRSALGGHMHYVANGQTIVCRYPALIVIERSRMTSTLTDVWEFAKGLLLLVGLVYAIGWPIWALLAPLVQRHKARRKDRAAQVENDERLHVELMKLAAGIAQNPDAVDDDVFRRLPVIALRAIAFDGLCQRNRWLAANTLLNGHFGGEEGVLSWELLNTHPDVNVRISAAQKVGTPRAFIQLLRDGSAEARRVAVDKLYSKPEHKRLITDFFTSEQDASIRVRIIQLGIFDEDPSTLAEIAERDPDPKVRDKANECLVAINKHKARSEHERRHPDFGRCTKCRREGVLYKEFNRTNDQTDERMVIPIDPLCHSCMSQGGYFRG